MNRRSMFTAIAVALPLALVASEAAAQPTSKSVAGVYEAVSVPAFGDKPRGQMILTNSGYYSIVVRRTKLAPVASGARNKGTDAENKALADGSIAHFGKYTIEDGGKAITFHVEHSSFPNWDGKPQKRALKMSGETLTYTVATPSTGGTPNDVTWKRVARPSGGKS
jgi:hypothetical protein